MLFTFSLRSIRKRTKLIFMILILLTIIFYILPKLLTFFWDGKPGHKLRDEKLLEKPLRVFSIMVYNT